MKHYELNESRDVTARLRALTTTPDVEVTIGGAAACVARCRILEALALDYAASARVDTDPHRRVRAGRHAVAVERHAAESWVSAFDAFLHGAA